MRKEVNRCDCGERKLRQLDDLYKTIICSNCEEVISYELPDNSKPKREKSTIDKKDRKVEKGRYKKRYEEIMLPSQEEKSEKDYGFEINKVYNEDANLTMERPNFKVDYIFTSPPYNIGGSYKKYGKKGEEHQDDMSQNEYCDWSIALIERMLKVTNKHIFYNIQEFADNRIAIDTFVEHFKYKIKEKCIWAKDHGNPATNAQVMTSSWEYIFVFSNDEPLKKSFSDAWFGGKFSNLIKGIKRGKNPDADINKATFPLGLPRKFIMNFGKRGDIWYDPFMGTGTTARACILEGRKYVGSELSKKMHTRCLSNIKRAINEPYFDFFEEVEVVEKPKIEIVDGLKQGVIEF